jgi:hypothetical protein
LKEIKKILIKERLDADGHKAHMFRKERLMSSAIDCLGFFN